MNVPYAKNAKNEVGAQIEGERNLREAKQHVVKTCAAVDEVLKKMEVNGDARREGDGNGAR